MSGASPLVPVHLFQMAQSSFSRPLVFATHHTEPFFLLFGNTLFRLSAPRVIRRGNKRAIFLKTASRQSSFVILGIVRFRFAILPPHLPQEALSVYSS